MTFGLKIAFLLLLAAGTAKGLTSTVPTRGDGSESSPVTVPDQGSSTTVSTTGGSSTTTSTITDGSSTTASTTTDGVTTTDCPPGDRWRLILQALLHRWFNNGRGLPGGPGGSGGGRGPRRGGFKPGFGRYPRGLKIIDLLRGGNADKFGPSPTEPIRPSPTDPTGPNDDFFNLANALRPDDGQFHLDDALASDFQENVLHKLDAIGEEVRQLFRLLPRIIAQRPPQ